MSDYFRCPTCGMRLRGSYPECIWRTQLTERVCLDVVHDAWTDRLHTLTRTLLEFLEIPSACEVAAYGHHQVIFHSPYGKDVFWSLRGVAYRFGLMAVVHMGKDTVRTLCTMGETETIESIARSYCEERLARNSKKGE